MNRTLAAIILAATSTGLAVTGTLSATGAISGTTLSVSALPTADPNVAGALWRSTNTVMVSTG